MDFLLTSKRDKAAARRFLERAINLHDVPEKIAIDKSGASTAAIESVKADACVDILMRQSKYLNNLVEQDHRAVKRVTGPMLGLRPLSTETCISAVDPSQPDGPVLYVCYPVMSLVLQKTALGLFQTLTDH